MKIGVLATGFNCSEYFDQVLEPWLKYKEKHGNLTISAVSGAFKENEVAPFDNTKELMLHAYNTKQIDYLIMPVGQFNEAQMRNFALGPLLTEKVDYVILLDFDEIYALEQIEKIFEFVEKNPFTIWFKIHFKNYIIDKKHYVKDFCPPRIFKAENLAEFFYDNDLAYLSSKDPSSLVRIDYRNFPSMEIPNIFVAHYSWCGSPERLKQKLKYQNAHFNGICSYKWDDEKNQLTLNMDFYQKYKIPVPTIYEEK